MVKKARHMKAMALPGYKIVGILAPAQYHTFKKVFKLRLCLITHQAIYLLFPRIGLGSFILSNSEKDVLRTYLLDV